MFPYNSQFQSGVQPNNTPYLENSFEIVQPPSSSSSIQDQSQSYTGNCQFNSNIGGVSENHLEEARIHPYSMSDYLHTSINADFPIGFSNPQENSYSSPSSQVPFRQSHDNIRPGSSSQDAESLEDITTWSPRIMQEAAAVLMEDSPGATSNYWEDPTSNSHKAFVGDESYCLSSATTICESHPQAVATQSTFQPSPASSSTKRKLKVYQWPPQTDPVLEAKRLRAIKAEKNRSEKEKQERDLNINIRSLDAEVLKLRKERDQRLSAVSQLEDHLSRLDLQNYSGQSSTLPRDGF